MTEHHRRLERMYLAAPCNQAYAPRIAIAQGRCEIAIPVRPEFLHAARALHGSVYFKALDDAAFFAANSLVPERFVLTSQFTLYFLKAVDRGELRAQGRVVHESKRQVLAEAVATDTEGTPVARGSGIFAKTDVPLPP